MSKIDPASVVSIHPYFRIKPGKLDKVRALLGEFVEKTGAEEGNLYYDFTFAGDVMHCREAYVGAEGLLKHIENVGNPLGKLLKLADLIRAEVHGSAGELDKLKAPLADLKPEWFVFETGVRR